MTFGSPSRSEDPTDPTSTTPRAPEGSPDERPGTERHAGHRQHPAAPERSRPEASAPLVDAHQQRRGEGPRQRADRPRTPDRAPAPACHPLDRQPLLRPRQHQDRPPQEGPGPHRRPAPRGGGMSPAEVLLAAADKVQFEGWTQFAYAQGANGKTLAADCPNAV